MQNELFLVELGGLVLLLAVLARIAVRLGLSPIPLYLLAGLAFGEGGVIPLVTATSFIRGGAEIGLILLLFSLGLQSRAADFTETLRSSGWAGFADVVLTFLPGLGAGLLLGWSPLAAVLLGGVAYNTSSSIVARTLDELGWLGNRETPVTLAITVLEDLVMAVYLPVMTILIFGGSLAGIAISIGLAIVSIGGALMLGRRHGLALGRAIFSRSDEALLLAMLGVGLLVAGTAQRAGLSAAVGAFLAGIVFSGPAADRAQRLLRPIRDVFAAVFFVFFGFQIDPRSVPETALVAAGLAAVGALGKYATGWWSARRAGIGPRGRHRAGLVLMPRAEFSLAIAGLAVSAGIEADLGPMAATYVLVLAVVSPIAARLLDRRQARTEVPRRHRA